MANKTYIGVNGVSHEVKTVFIGVDNVARKVKKIYIGDENGKARLCFNAHTHTYVSFTYEQKDTTYHWYVQTCDCGESIREQQEHSYGEPTYIWGDYSHTSCTASADCNCGYTLTEEGTVSRNSYYAGTCTEREHWDYIARFSNFSSKVCPDYHYGNTDPNNHTGSVVESGRTASTCVTNGTVSYKYDCCSASAGTSSLELNPDNHEGEPNVLDENTVIWATCVDEGYAEMRYECCGALGATLTLPIDPNNHKKFIYLAYTAPTCTEHGTIESKLCDGCKKWFDSNGNEISDDDIIIDALGHDTEGVSYSYDDTNHWKVCERCNENIEVGAHDYDWLETEPTCTEQGYKDFTCYICGYAYQGDYVDALGHNHQVVEVIKPTCTAQGYTAYACTKCGDSYNGNYTPALGHATLTDYSLAPDTFGPGTGVYVTFTVNRGIHSDISSVTVIVRSSSGGDTTYNVSLDSEGYGYVTVYANWATGAHDVYVSPGCCSSHEIHIGSFNYNGKNDIYS